jgi:cyclopropane fatty-acyl-phospholipid synthase-like methyltransferase
VLDVATGTGLWPMQMAERYPKATIVGTDLSPIQPKDVLPNIYWFVEDA